MLQEQNIATPAAPSAPVAAPQPMIRRILIAEDDETSRRQLQAILSSDPVLRVEVVSDGAQALQAIESDSFSVAVTDLRMPKLDGLSLIKAVQSRKLPVTVIVTTGQGSIDDAVQAMRMGAYDFLTKPIDPSHLNLVIQRALRDRALQDEVAQLRSQLQSRFAFHNIISKNPRMHAVFELISNLAHSTTTVLIEGETGTGKEQVARAIHESSIGRNGPLVAVNCAALPESLLESELFGHEKGAFTSAVKDRQGRFELANGGTMFLDEVGDVPAAMQAKLLRVLQERRFERVGGTTPIEVDVRVIAATNRSLQEMVREGKFREDLFYRLNVVKIDLPPLRERPEDIPLLATFFAQKYAPANKPPKSISPGAMEALIRYRWPGNIRELENAIERGSVTCMSEAIQLDNLPLDIVNPVAHRNGFNVEIDRPLPDLLTEITAKVERQYLTKALKKARGNVGLCAKICGLSRRSISAKIGEYELDKAIFKNE